LCLWNGIHWFTISFIYFGPHLNYECGCAVALPEGLVVHTAE